jgi:cation diffusion facilitator CzcD-associated flavoprotein CzcO
MTSTLKDKPTLASSLVPTFPVGCRRITPGDAYLKSLVASNVTVIADPIQICQEGIKLKSGEITKLDAIVCATGFDCSFVPRYPLIGEYANLQDLWRDKQPEAYMSCMIAGMPNYFSKSLPPFSEIQNLSISNTNPNSIPRPQRAPSPRRHPPNRRTTLRLHPQTHPQNPTPSHPLRASSPLCNRRLLGTYRCVYAQDCVE